MADFTDPWLPDPSDKNTPVASARPAIRVEVYRLDPDPEGDDEPEYLSSLVCLAVEEHVGDAPASAQFRYKFDGRDQDSPQTFEQALSTAVTAKSLPHLVEVGDRLGVRAYQPDGTPVWLFDGFALVWSARIDAGSEQVVLTATGVAKRAWDTPIGGPVYRDASDPEAVNDVPCPGLVAQFNPKGVPNASPSTADSGEDPRKYPVFLDPGISGTDTDGNDYPRTWDLPMAVANVLYLNNDETWVSTPKRTVIDGLVAREPKDGVPFDPNDPSSYTAKPFAAPDTPLQGNPWPSVVRGLVKDFGFETRWVLSSDADGLPRTTFDVFLLQGQPTKPLLLGERGSRFSPTTHNLGAADLGRDLSGVVNRWVVNGAPNRYEVTLVLAPGFPSQSSDASAMGVYDATDPAFATSDAYDKYRLWVFDETGEGHYANASTSKISGTATSLDDVFGAPVPDGEGINVPQYATRRRAPVGKLFKLGPDGRPLSYRVSISTDYTGAKPGVWDGTGHWRPVSGFTMLPDRIGVRFGEKHPNKNYSGPTTDTSAPYQSGKINIVEAIAAPTTANPAFFVRLTCVIEGDQCLTAVAERQDTSPLATPITRTVDARDRFRLQTRAKWSEFNVTATAQTHEDDSKLRDDTDDALAEAVARRTASEAGVMEGAAVIPRFTAAYNVGDRISEIRGRGLGLRTDTGGSGYAAVLPVVVSRRWDLDGEQQTTLQISDAGLDRRRYGLRTGAQSFVARLSGKSPGGTPDVSQSEIRRLRMADDDARDDATRLVSHAEPGAASFVAKVTTGAANACCTLTRQAVTGAEVQGGAGTFSAAETLVALNLGGGTPPANTVVLVTQAGDRFVFRYDA